MAIDLLGALGTVGGWIGRMIGRRVRLRVEAGAAWTEAGDVGVTISATNLSSFPVTVEELGIVLLDGRRALLNAHQRTLDGRTFPVRVESQERIVVFWPGSRQTTDLLARAATAYARTSCGVRRTGHSESFPQVVEIAREVAGAAQ